MISEIIVVAWTGEAQEEEALEVVDSEFAGGEAAHVEGQGAFGLVFPAVVWVCNSPGAAVITLYSLISGRTYVVNQNWTLIANIVLLLLFFHYLNYTFFQNH